MIQQLSLQKLDPMMPTTALSLMARPSICRECLRGLRSFIRTRSIHNTSEVFSDQAVKFDAFFSRNEAWSRTGPFAIPQERTSPAKNNNIEESWPSYTQPDNAFKSEFNDAYPPPATSVSYRPVPELTLKRRFKLYAQLSKSRLTALIVLTAMSSVAVSPVSVSVPVLLATAAGTTLCAASANAFNQLQEVPFDAQMARTRNRPLVRRAITPLHAAGFAAVTGIAGPVILWTCVNPTTALLGAGNIILYAGIYTYLKRRSVINTWVGSVVGGIPPVMGWTACNGHLLPSATTPVHLFLPPFLLDPTLPPLPVEFANNPLAPLALFMILFSWQFPHFNSLSHLIRGSYAQAGYQMLSAVNPRLNKLVSLRHSILLIPICSVLVPLSGLTTWTFALTSLLPNITCTYYAWDFWKKGTDKEARKLFFTCLWYLPVVMGLLMVHKNGMDWGRWVKSFFVSEPEDDRRLISQQE